jgi:hypothetical protein
MSVDHGSGVWVLENPLTNKGTAFSEEERSEQGLRGLLPTVVETLEQQVRRRYQAYQEQPTDVPGTLTCARCRTPTRRCSTGWRPTTSRRCSRSFTPRRSDWPAGAPGPRRSTLRRRPRASAAPALRPRLEHHPSAELRRGPGCLLFAPGAQRDDQRDLVAREQLSCHGGGQPSTGRAACQEPGEQLARVGGAQPAQLRDAALCRSRQAR